jgi:hypothetical protein
MPEARTCAGYGMQRVIVLAQRSCRCSIDCALAMCDKVVDIWFKRVTKIIGSLNKDEPVPAAMSLEQPQILGEYPTWQCT